MAKYFAYRKEIQREGEPRQIIYVLRPSALTLLAGEAGLIKNYVPRTSFSDREKLREKLVELKNARAKIILTRLSVFSLQKSTEIYEHREETIWRTPLKGMENLINSY